MTPQSAVCLTLGKGYDPWLVCADAITEVVQGFVAQWRKERPSGQGAKQWRGDGPSGPIRWLAEETAKLDADGVGVSMTTLYKVSVGSAKRIELGNADLILTALGRPDILQQITAEPNPLVKMSVFRALMEVEDDE